MPARPLAREYGNRKSAADLTIEEFMVPQKTVLKSQSIIARAAARHMLKQHSGVIIFLAGGPARAHMQGTTATIQYTMDDMTAAMNITKDQAAAALADLTMLKMPASVTGTAKAAAFLASGHARMMTGTVLNSSGGAVAD